MLKKIFGLSLLVAVSCTASAQQDSTKSTAQEIKEGFTEAGNEVKETAVLVGNKTAEITVKAFHSVKDKRLKNKQGPDGEDVFVDAKSRYYTINERGGKEYLRADQLKDK